jgi:aldehyde dehydrogenase (NAD+)
MQTPPETANAKTYGHWLNGHFTPVTPPGSSGRIAMIDPSHGSVIAQVSRGTAADIDAAVQTAQQALHTIWKKMAASERGRLLARIAQLVQQHAEELWPLEMADCGKTARQAQADVAALARYFEYYAGAADKLHADTIPYQTGFAVMTWREPHGVTGHIIPWNYPLQIFGRSVGAALAAGNCCVVKPAEDACLSLLRLAELTHEAGLPPGVLNIVTGYGREAGEALIQHAGVDHISFTGSAATGTRVAQACAARHCPVTLELGGKSPQIIFADADVETAMPAVVSAIIQNSGQTCSAGSRVLIEEPIYEAMLDKLAARFSALRVGPAAMNLDCGPLINQRQLQRVWDFLSDAQHDGIEIMASGHIIDEAPETGFYQAPALLRDVPPAQRIAQEEVFGPVLCAMKFRDEAEAVALANGTPYGLVAGVWTRDGARQWRMARELQCGQVFINNYGAGGGVELPFGGVKASGYGREKGFEALLGFTQLKTTVIRYE